MSEALQRAAASTRVVAAIVLAAVAVSAAGCGDDTAKAPATTTTSTAKVTTTTAVDATTTTAAATDDEVDPAVATAWDADAQAHRGEDGAKFSLECPPKGKLFAVWGTETYTDDSSVCSAAVQEGLITVASGGTVEYQIAAGQAEYAEGVANGVTSIYYGPFSGSFTLPAVPSGSVTFEPSPASWSRNASQYSSEMGKQVTVRCSPGGPAASAWGTGTYTVDSSICTAAVHAGLITVAAGGAVTAEVTAGADAYQGSAANGITTSDYGKYAASITFPEAQPAG